MPARLPDNLMTPFQRANVGKVVTGHSGILPFGHRNPGAALAPTMAHQTNPAVVLNRGIIPNK